MLAAEIGQIDWISKALPSDYSNFIKNCVAMVERSAAALTTTGNSYTAELWAADGTTSESSALTATWKVNRVQVFGAAWQGLVASSGGDGSFKVNYLLIQADGLPIHHRRRCSRTGKHRSYQPWGDPDCSPVVAGV